MFGLLIYDHNIGHSCEAVVAYLILASQELANTGKVQQVQERERMHAIGQAVSRTDFSRTFVPKCSAR